MRPADNIHKQIRDLRMQASAELDERLYEKFQRALEQKQATAAFHRSIQWRVIMRSRITKLATAAVIIAAAAVSIMVFNKSMPRAFGIEQVIAASDNIRFLHVKKIWVDREEPDEFWIESDELGKVIKARYYLPVTEDGIKLIVWTPEKTEHWAKSKHRFFIYQTSRIEGWMQRILDQCQPKLVMKELLEKQKAGEVDIDIQQPQDKRKPALIVAKFKTEPNKKWIYYIDQATDLITRVENYSNKDNHEALLFTGEFSDYNVPIDEKMFSLKDEIPKDVIVHDKLNQLIGVAQGDMSDEQAAAETVRQFFQALIDKDYKKAGLIQSGELEEYTKEEFGGLNVTAIVSIGPTIPQPDWDEHGCKVPCELEIINSGQKTTWKPGVYVRPGDDEMHRDRWNITGGINVNEAQIKILPDNEKYEKMTPKEAAEAFFKACAEKNWDEFSKFWPVWGADERMEQMTEQIKGYLGGLEIISIGEPYKTSDYPGWYVPFEIKLPPREVYLQLSDENAAERFVIIGYCDGKLQNCKDVKWIKGPDVLPDNDAYANMSADVAVEAFNNALAKRDFNEMQKFAPDSFVERLKAESEEATKLGAIKQGQSILEVAGQAFWSEEHSAYFVKCRMIGVIKLNLMIRNDNPAKRYIFDDWL